MRGLSPEASFQLAYTGVLALATAAIRAAGYRLRAGEGHHRRTFEAALIALGPEAGDLLDFFDVCRRKRNVISYEGSEASEGEAADMLSRAGEFEPMWCVRWDSPSWRKDVGAPSARAAERRFVVGVPRGGRAGLAPVERRGRGA